MRLEGKHIVLGITGSIAAYKAAILIRLLRKEGAEVQVLMTPSAKDFITPLTVATLSSRPILVENFNPENGAWNSHVQLGIWADALLIAPATANTLAKMASGIADNLLLTTYLSARCPVFVAPAMDVDMYAHPATRQSLDILQQRGVQIIEPALGFLASGLEGKGRMEEPEGIVESLIQLGFCLFTNTVWEHKKIIVTAGPTYEKIDPVRFVGNFASGKMGFAIAEELARRGADVILVSGPTHLKVAHDHIQTVSVTSAQEMLEACTQYFPTADGAVMAAAVADYTPMQTATEKLKKQSDNLQITLKPTVDIAATLGEMKTSHQILVGFALETHDEAAHATQKLIRKRLDFIVLNSLQDPGAGFQYDTNKITIITSDHQTITFPLKTKRKVACDIVEQMALYL